MLVVMNAILTIPINFNAHKARELLYVVVCVCAMHGMCVQMQGVYVHVFMSV